MVDANRWKVLLHVEKDRDALWLVQALENSRRIELAWLAKNSEEAELYLRGHDIYHNRAKYPLPNLVIVNAAPWHALKLLKAARELCHPPLMVQLTATPDVSECLRAMGAGVDCCQPRPGNLEETLAFVDWLEDWLETVADSDDIPTLSLVRDLPVSVGVDHGIDRGNERGRVAL